MAAKADQYVKMIRSLRYPGLMRLWRGIVAGNTPGWPVGKAFEYLVLRAFELEKAHVTYPFPVKLPSGIDEQIDGVIYAPGIVAIAESKDRGPMNVEPIAKLRSQLMRRPSAAVGVFFSQGGFTLPALALAQQLAPQTILLWPGDEIERALTKRRMLKGLRVKYQKAVEYGMSDFSLLTRGIL